MRKQRTTETGEEVVHSHAKPRARVHARDGTAIVPTMTANMAHNGRAVMEALAKAFTPETIVAKYVELLNANVEWVNKKGKVSKRPDSAVRLRTLDILTVTLIGKPVERAEVITHSPPASIETLMADAKRSPVFRKTLIDLLQNLTKDEKEATPTGKPFKEHSEPTDIEPD